MEEAIDNTTENINELVHHDCIPSSNPQPRTTETVASPSIPQASNVNKKDWPDVAYKSVSFMDNLLGATPKK